MKFKKHIQYKTPKQIWRILITDSEKLLIEKRDTNNKEVLFDCYVLETKEKIFEDFQLEEKFWIGVERIYKDIIYFHKYAKPDMPGHKDITALDINTQKVIWKNEQYAFLFIHKDKLYAYKQKFEGRVFYSLNYKTGELIEELGEDTQKMNKLYDEAREAEDYSHYNFPARYNENQIEPGVKEIVTGFKNKFDIKGEVEYNKVNNTLLMSFHNKAIGESLLNRFSAVDINTREEIFSEVLSPSTDTFMTDSFFIYKDFLFLLKEKNGVDVLKIKSE